MGARCSSTGPIAGPARSATSSVGTSRSNRARLPESKEATISALREALERHGVDTAPWWERQLRLSLLGTLVQFGWEKALGDEAELGWWCDRATEGAALL